MEVFEAVQVVGPEQRRVIDSITQFFRLPLGVIAPVRLDHPIFNDVHEEILAQSRRDGTMLTATQDEAAPIQLALRDTDGTVIGQSVLPLAPGGIVNGVVSDPGQSIYAVDAGAGEDGAHPS